RPAEELPELGAARMYVADEDWQTVVADLLSRARTVVLQAGETQGLRWEVERVGQAMKPEQVLLFVPVRLGNSNGPEASYSRFREWARASLPADLPEKIGDSFFVYFEGKRPWTAHALRGQDPALERHSLREVLREFLKDRAFRRRWLSHLVGRILWLVVVVL